LLYYWFHNRSIFSSFHLNSTFIDVCRQLRSWQINFCVVIWHSFSSYRLLCLLEVIKFLNQIVYLMHKFSVPVFLIWIIIICFNRLGCSVRCILPFFLSGSCFRVCNQISIIYFIIRSNLEILLHFLKIYWLAWFLGVFKHINLFFIILLKILLLNSFILRNLRKR